ncbi:MAG: c-type cytochrome domain-containing protein [Saprospiraceae bacterium]
MSSTNSKILLLGAFILITSLWRCTTEPFAPSTPIDNPDNGNGGGSNNDNLCPDGVVSFTSEVLPVILSSCAFSGCHDVASHQEGVVLTTYAGIKREVKAGNPGDSKIYEVITKTSGEEKMPPSPYTSLNADQIKRIKTWIEQGAMETNCQQTCDPMQASFVANVFPSLQTTCLGCHNDNLMNGGVNFKDYDNIKVQALNGKLLGVLKGETGYPTMPPSGSPLASCKVSQIERWVTEGAQNN